MSSFGAGTFGAGLFGGVMASTGTAFWPGASSFPNTTQYPGQGLLPIVRARYSTDDLSDSTPTWTELTAIQLRNFSISRGRSSELAAFEAGTATLTLDDRTRTFDPTSNALIAPLNRWWLYEEFSGEVHDLFRGYAESYELQYPEGGWSGALSVVSCTDEFKVLALANLQTTSPPRNSYSELIQSDQPDAYWPMNDIPERGVQTPQEDSPGTGTDETPPAPPAQRNFGFEDVYGGIWRYR